MHMDASKFVGYPFNGYLHMNRAQILYLSNGTDTNIMLSTSMYAVNYNGGNLICLGSTLLSHCLAWKASLIKLMVVSTTEK